MFFDYITTLAATTSVDSSALDEYVKGLFSDQMKDIVINAGTQNYVVYAFLLLSVILMIIVLIMTRVNVNNIIKTIQPYFSKIESLTTDLSDCKKTYEKMLKKFEDLENELIRQDLSRNNNDKIDEIIRKISEYEKNDQIALNNIINEIRELDRNTISKYIEQQNILQKFLMDMLGKDGGNSNG